MLCLHGEPAGSTTTENGTFWYCKQPSICHFAYYDDDKHKDLYCEGVKTFLATNQELPKCCAVNKTSVNDETPNVVERNNAKLCVYVNEKKESFGRPFFMCSKVVDKCNYYVWGDEKIIKYPLCEHGKPCRLMSVKRGRMLFDCNEPWEKRCMFRQWFTGEPEDYLRREEDRQ